MKAFVSTLIVTLALASGTLAFGQDSRLARAQLLYQRTQYRDALALLRGKDVRDPEVLLLAGKSYLMLGEFKPATEELSKAVQVSPSNSEYWLWLGRALGRRAETSSFLTAPKYAIECRKAFEKAIDLDPKNTEALSDLLEYYLAAPGFMGGGTDKAREMARRIGELDPIEKHSAAARLAEEKEEFPTAERELRLAAELAPQHVGRLIDLAKFLARRGRTQESDQTFARADQVAPNKPALLFAKAQVYIQGKRKLAEARELLRKYLSSDLTPDDPSREEAQKLLREAQAHGG